MPEKQSPAISAMHGHWLVPKPGKKHHRLTKAIEKHFVFLWQSVFSLGVSYTKNVRNKSKHTNNCRLNRNVEMNTFQFCRILWKVWSQRT